MDKQELIVKIKQKKELSDLDNEIVKESLTKYLKTHNISLINLTSSDLKIIIKDIRKDLRSLSGQYQKSLKSKQKLLQQNKIQELLRTHTSTAERIHFYPKLKSMISKIKPKSILDLGCGLNPIALASPDFKYYASDIKTSELSLIKQYFEKNKIKGKTFIFDIRKTSKISSLPKADLCLLFKVLDVITKESKLISQILKNLNCKNILVSFSTKTLSGKPMSYPRRYWFENLLNALDFNYKTILSSNEIFYLIEKSNPKITSPQSI
tara:strand:+ start:6296 stop:7093 length:798 start_codon:yes stop_codon:yes gene_type:complete